MQHVQAEGAVLLPHNGEEHALKAQRTLQHPVNLRPRFPACAYSNTWRCDSSSRMACAQYILLSVLAGMLYFPAMSTTE